MVTIEATLDDYTSSIVSQDTMSKGTLHIGIDTEDSIIKLYGTVEEIEKLLNESLLELEKYKKQIKR